RAAGGEPSLEAFAHLGGELRVVVRAYGDHDGGDPVVLHDVGQLGGLRAFSPLFGLAQRDLGGGGTRTTQVDPGGDAGDADLFHERGGRAVAPVAVLAVGVGGVGTGAFAGDSAVAQRDNGQRAAAGRALPR